MSFVGVSAVVDRADDLLPAARKLIDAETAALEADPNVAVSCKPNCNSCCEHAVVVTAAESRAIAVAVAQLPAPAQGLIASRAREVLARVVAELPGDASTISGVDVDFSRDYYALREPCPLLLDGCCSVREVRPLVCREYLMTSAPEHCDDRTLDRAVKIRRRRNVSSGFQGLASRFDDPAPRLLLTALLEPAEPPIARPMSGPKLARLLTSS